MSERVIPLVKREETQNETLITQIVTISITLFSLGYFYQSILNNGFSFKLLFIIPLLAAFNFYLVNYKPRYIEYITSECLCLCFIYSFISLLNGYTFSIQLYFYVMSLCIYHFAEYFFVLLYHYDTLKFSSFLIDQSKEWGIATGTSFIELLIENFFFNRIKSSKIIITMGLICMIIGHVFRISALYTAKSNFTHLVATRKKEKHVLVKNGIYKFSRHPSYFGFFIWSVGTQIMCNNPICILGFTFVLYHFFKDRILHEEYMLITFFGQDYVNYRKEVPILIPCKNSLFNFI